MEKREGRKEGELTWKSFQPQQLLINLAPQLTHCLFFIHGNFFPLVVDAEEWEKGGDLFLPFESSSRPKMAFGSPLDPP